MDNAGNIFSYIILAVSFIFFIVSMRSRHKLRKNIQKNEEAILLKETENKELRMLTAGVTHEINNAISIILGRTEQIIKRNVDSSLDKGLDNIILTSERIVTSVKGLRQFLYPNASDVEEFIELPDLMEEVLKLSGQRLRNHGIELQLKGLDHKIIKGRKAELEQMIINLINQSIERLDGLEQRWVQLVAVEENGALNMYYMDSSAEVGDKLSLKGCREVLEKNHGHLIVNQNNLCITMPKPEVSRFHS